MKTITINVTKTGIKCGKRDNFRSCPIARAAKARGLKDVTVLCEDIHFVRNSREYLILLPKKAINFINRFDSGLPVKPFSFRLTID